MSWKFSITSLLVSLTLSCAEPPASEQDGGGALEAGAARAETRVICPNGPNNPRNSEGDIVVLKDGRLLLAYSDFFRSNSDHAQARISGKISGDGGKTWGESFVMVENEKGLRNAMIASFLRLQDGRIMLGYNKKVSLADCRFYVRFSSDEGESWSEEILVTGELAYGAVYSYAPTQLSSGRILAPYSYSPDYEQENHFRVKVYYSDDGGRQWQSSNAIVDLPERGAMEPGVLELKGGSILMHLRTQFGRAYKSVSTDQGLTWTEPEKMPLRNPESPTAMARIPSTGDLLAVFNDNYNPKESHHRGARRPLTAALSKDEGETWSHFHNIATDLKYEYSYPSITFMDDQVLLSYHNATVSGEGREQTRELVFGSIPLEWFYRE